MCVLLYYRKKIFLPEMCVPVYFLTKMCSHYTFWMKFSSLCVLVYSSVLTTQICLECAKMCVLGQKRPKIFLPKKCVVVYF